MKPEIFYWMGGVLVFLWVCRWAYRSGFNWCVYQKPNPFLAPNRPEEPEVDLRPGGITRYGVREDLTNATTFNFAFDNIFEKRAKSVILMKREIEQSIGNGER